MSKRKKKGKKKRADLTQKEVTFSLPLRVFLLMCPNFPIPLEIDVTDPAYIVRFKRVGGHVLAEIGYAEDDWML